MNRGVLTAVREKREAIRRDWAGCALRWLSEFHNPTRIAPGLKARASTEDLHRSFWNTL